MEEDCEYDLFGRSPIVDEEDCEDDLFGQFPAISEKDSTRGDVNAVGISMSADRDVKMATFVRQLKLVERLHVNGGPKLGEEVVNERKDTKAAVDDVHTACDVEKAAGRYNEGTGVGQPANGAEESVSVGSQEAAVDVPVGENLGRRVNLVGKACTCRYCEPVPASRRCGGCGWRYSKRAYARLANAWRLQV